MRHWSSQLFIRFGIAVAIVGGWLLLPTHAQASCGDYLTINGVPGAMAHHATSEPHESAPTVPQDCPCQGPGCSQNVPLPGSPTIPNAQRWLSPDPLLSQLFVMIAIPTPAHFDDGRMHHPHSGFSWPLLDPPRSE